MALDERSILTSHAHLCGVCAMEFRERQFRTPAFDAWMQSLVESGDPIMSMRLVRVGEVTDEPVGCAPCWGHGLNVHASFSIEITIDGDG